MDKENPTNKDDFYKNLSVTAAETTQTGELPSKDVHASNLVGSVWVVTQMQLLRICVCCSNIYLSKQEPHTNQRDASFILESNFPANITKVIFNECHQNPSSKESLVDSSQLVKHLNLLPLLCFHTNISKLESNDPNG